MGKAIGGFDVRETHGILGRAGLTVRTSSDGRGWTSLYASTQTEAPFEGHFDAVQDHLIVLHLGGPVIIDRAFGAGSERRLIPAGGLHMIPSGVGFDICLGGKLDTMHLYLRRSVLREVAAEMVPGDPDAVEFLPRFGDRDPQLERLILAVRDALDDEDPSTSLLVDYLARALAARLVRAHSSASQVRTEAASLANADNRRLARAIDFMTANIERSIDMAAIAGAAGQSVSHVVRLFRKGVGMAPHQYLIQMRLEHAERLLAETAMPIVEIAFACGFSHQEHLTRLFRRHRGTTPAAYRRARRS
ncbi:helix-turn-helix domain-containing protein [Arenibaculum pallidiluteum]|uniref:helix-turn-helix domain-containing protein n=1 Tax=Arenibaculum pallidiluteum TaxID=2812559 RepID=UPI001A956947|nr:AraC family transcriptional regulator [Arenibaculum pallidiluteum]